MIEDLTVGELYSAESKQLRGLTHRNVVKYEDDFIHADYSSIEPIYSFMIAMEFCEGVRPSYI